LPGNLQDVDVCGATGVTPQLIGGGKNQEDSFVSAAAKRYWDAIPKCNGEKEWRE
jgi:hypothetical protein